MFRARVIAKDLPRSAAHQRDSPREPVDRRPPRQKARIVRANGFDRGLLQHDFGKPDAVGVGPFAVPGALAPVATAIRGRAGRTRREDRQPQALPLSSAAACGLLRSCMANDGISAPKLHDQALAQFSPAAFGAAQRHLERRHESAGVRLDRNSRAGLTSWALKSPPTANPSNQLAAPDRR